MGFHGILRVSPKRLDDDVLLYPLEENLYIPTVAVKICDFQRTDFEVVGDKCHFVASLHVVIDHHAYGLRVEFAGLWGGESYGEVCSNARFGVEVRPMVNHLIPHIVLRAAYPIGSGPVEPVKGLQVNIRLVHHVEGKRLEHIVYGNFRDFPF